MIKALDLLDHKWPGRSWGAERSEAAPGDESETRRWRAAWPPRLCCLTPGSAIERGCCAYVALGEGGGRAKARELAIEHQVRGTRRNGAAGEEGA